MATRGSCRTTPFADRTAARTVSRRTKLANQIETKIEFCEKCDAWHLVANDDRLDDINRQVLLKIAQGLRAHEIAKDLGLTEYQIVHRVEELTRIFKALSRANLIATAIWLKAIDMTPIMPQFDDHAEIRRSWTKGNDEQ